MATYRYTRIWNTRKFYFDSDQTFERDFDSEITFVGIFLKNLR